MSSRRAIRIYYAAPERYRSGHTGADSKSDGQGNLARGFESLPLLQFLPRCIALVKLPRGIFAAAPVALCAATFVYNVGIFECNDTHGRRRHSERLDPHRLSARREFQETA